MGISHAFGTLTSSDTPTTTAGTKNTQQLQQTQSFGGQPRAWDQLTDEVHLLHEASLTTLGEVAILSNAQKPTQSIRKSEETGEYVVLTKEQVKSPETNLIKWK